MLLEDEESWRQGFGVTSLKIYEHVMRQARQPNNQAKFNSVQNRKNNMYRFFFLHEIQTN